ncbi:hypothetical protein [Roseivirga pacifica]|uniref:hypothetical protein n=1 Tax=Roseivirga pacifica TaxID=1267423 RepID=UPI0020947442|nr:hypothetical protein [Roseivirga pacifica]MCO6359510.1 hypothetical protein [Roseivirga pacifica]MCO6366880.1 hypothetical protein [Roseivirga pacifica]MCO6370588.1 hypothetical protein [Roseivirga pacifica]MCO6374537.1 hypothetical protein [Roseivirga pacifica]MCO6379795.1 hypothetical protein [Roseivirga pacifica]
MPKTCKSTILPFLLLFCLGCSKNSVDEQVIFWDDFEQTNSPEVGSDVGYYTFHNADERYIEFNGSRNLGQFERGGITLNLGGIPEHDYLRISFDLYIHDKWEGNGERGNGEDVFIMNIDGATLYFSSIINTKCQTQECEGVQSFPDIIKTTTNPENAEVKNASLPGLCHYKGEIGGSKLIQIARKYPHATSDLKLRIAADIKDAGPDLCYKSWSIDNLKVTSVELPER